MDKDTLFSVSIEKMAAYLDGNLPEDEMAKIQSSIKMDSDLSHLWGEITSDSVNPSLGTTNQMPLELDIPDAWSLPDPMNPAIAIDMDILDDLFAHNINLDVINLDDFSVEEHHLGIEDY